MEHRFAAWPERADRNRRSSHRRLGTHPGGRDRTMDARARSEPEIVSSPATRPFRFCAVSACLTYRTLAGNISRIFGPQAAMRVTLLREAAEKESDESSRRDIGGSGLPWSLRAHGLRG